MLFNLGQLHCELGEYRTAEPLDVQALSIRGAALGDQAPLVGSSLDGLAELYRHKGDYSAAERLNR